ncbi:MAG: hypothetical protein ACJAUG_000432 [Halioglobus sp.]|jgi:hypothetical protein
MKHYSQKRKDAVLKRMMQPENAPLPMLAEETGTSKVPLYDWRKHAIAKGLVVPQEGTFCRADSRLERELSPG